MSLLLTKNDVVIVRNSAFPFESGRYSPSVRVGCVSPEVCDALLENLKLKVDAILQQKGKKPSVYGNQVGRTTKQIAEDKAVRRAERIKEKYGDNPPPLSTAPDSGGDVHNAA